MQHGDLVGDGARRGQIVGDRHRRAAHLSHPIGNQVVDRGGSDRIEPGGRLVEEQQFGRADDGTGKADALLHAAREFTRKAVRDIGAQPHQRQSLDRARARLAAVDAIGVDQAEADVFPHRQAVEQGRALEQHADTAHGLAALCGAHGGGVDAIEVDGAGIGLQQAQRQFQRHRLALPRSADQRQRAPALDREIKAIEHDLRAKAFRHPAPFELHCHGRANTDVIR